MNWSFVQQTGLGVLIIYGGPGLAVLAIGLGMVGWEHWKARRQKRDHERWLRDARLAQYHQRTRLFDVALDQMSDFGTDELTAIVRAVHDPAHVKPDDWGQWQQELKAGK